ncbi:MAG: hypothetical protein IKE66_04435 [Hyphomicrobium sp.]|nr:hypothetical protein [Hyphomicrobium sp.]
MLGNTVHAGNVYTASRCRVLKLHKYDFDRIEAQFPQVATRIRNLATSSIELEELSRLQQP